MALQHAIPLEIRINPDGVSDSISIELSKEFGFAAGPPSLTGFAVGFFLVNKEAKPDGALIDFVIPASPGVTAAVAGDVMTLTFAAPPTVITNVGVSLLFNG